MQKYLTNEEILAALARIEEVAQDLKEEVRLNNEAHEKFYKEFVARFVEEDREIADLKSQFKELYDKYFAARQRLKSE